MGSEYRTEQEPDLGRAGAAVLHELANGGPGHGWQLMERLDGQVASSTLYENLKRLRDMGLVEWRTEDGPWRGPPRKVYSVTGEGAAVAGAMASSQQSPGWSLA